jgi:all-trans-8'-apo-beta-carotenal 15,15'-oxygenase
MNAKAWAGEVTTSPKIFLGPPCFAYHHVNSYEDESGNIVLDSLAFSKFCPLDIYRQGHDGRDGKLVRHVIDPAAPTGSFVDQEVLNPHCAVMPTIRQGVETQQHQYVYAVDCEHEPYTGTIKVDVALREVVGRWRLEPGQYTQEAIFAEKAGDSGVEDDGYLLNLVFDGRTRRSFLQVLDAQDLNKGPLARLHLKGHVPYSFHSTFFSGKTFFGPAATTRRGNGGRSGSTGGGRTSNPMAEGSKHGLVDESSKL